MGRSSSARWARAFFVILTICSLVVALASFAGADETIVEPTTSETGTGDPPPEVPDAPPEEPSDPPADPTDPTGEPEDPEDPCVADPTAEGCETTSEPEEPEPEPESELRSLALTTESITTLTSSRCSATVNVSKVGGAGATFTAKVLYGIFPVGSQSQPFSEGAGASFTIPISDFFGCLTNGVTVFEESAPGWRQTDIWCDKGSEVLGTYVFDVKNGDVVNCTITNAPNTISVEKIVPEGAPPGDFDIVLEQFACEESWPPDCGFTQIHHANFSGNGSTTFGPLDLDAAIPHLGIFRVREIVPDGWTLTDVQCSGGLLTHKTEDGYFIKLSDLKDDWASASCQFSNEPNTASVTVTKVIGEAGNAPTEPWTFTGNVDDPVGEPTRFDTIGFPSTLALDTDGGGNAAFPMTAVSNDGSSVTFTETQKSAFAMSQVVCNGSEQTIVGSSWTLTVAPGDVIACTVRNLPAAIALTKVAEPDSGLVAGQQLTYTIEATNTGEATLDNVVVTDELPSELTFVSSDDCTAVDQDVTCDLGDGLAPGASRSASIVVEVNAGVVGEVVNVAEVTADPLGADDPVSAEASADVTVVEVGGEVVVVDPGTGEVQVAGAVAGRLPFTGSSSRWPLPVAGAALIAGLALVLAGRRRRSSTLGA